MGKIIYQVKPGYRFGALDQYEPGDKVELSPEEAQGFLDKLQPVEEPSTPANGGGEQPPSPWGALVPKLVEFLTTASLTPEMLPTTSDEALLAIDGIGPAALKQIREVFPAAQ
jgi:hypothetical protein